MKNHIYLVGGARSGLLLSRLLLEREGFTVSVARSKSTIERALFDNTPPDVLILDDLSSDVTGLDLLRDLKPSLLAAGIPAIVLLPYADEDRDAIEQAQKLGAAAYLTKPLLHHDLISSIKIVLEGMHQER